MDPLTVFQLGGCLLHGPMNVLAKNNRVRSARLSRGGGTPGTYTFGEMFQVLAMHRGESVVPADIRPLAGIKPDFTPLPHSGDLPGVDVVLVEPALQAEIVFRSYYLNRAAVSGTVITAIRNAAAATDDKAVAKHVAKQSRLWLMKGLMECDVAAQTEAARAIEPYIPADGATSPDLVREVLFEARGKMRPVREGFLELRRLVSRPIGVVGFVFQYMADGRPVSWPPSFSAEVRACAQEFGFPYFDPAGLIAEYGTARALNTDLRHYHEDFLGIAAEKIAEFAAGVVAPRPAVALGSAA